MNTPVIRFGGKTRLVPVLLSVLERMAPHTCYVEPFAGGAALLFAKEPSKSEIIGDMDRAIYDFFSVLRDEEQAYKLQRMLKYTLWSREEMTHCKPWRGEADQLERVRKWFTVMRQSFTHEVDNPAWWASKTDSQALRFSRAVDALDRASQRLRRVQVENRSFEHLFRVYDHPNTLFYCDPAYMMEARIDGGYEHEMTVAQHEHLLDLVLSCKGQVMLSGYHSTLYDERLAHLPCIEKTRECTIHNSKAKKKTYRTECIWFKAHPVGLFAEGGKDLVDAFATHVAARTQHAEEPREVSGTDAVITIRTEQIHMGNFSIYWEDVSKRFL